jgi:hypothetical protein
MLANPDHLAMLALDLHPRGLMALGANQHHIRNVERRFELDDTRINGAPLGLDLALMLGVLVQPLDYQAFFARYHFDDFAFLTSILKPAAN